MDDEPMDATLHHIIAAQYTQDRITEATSARLARSVQSPRRRFFRKPKLQAAADPGRAVARPARATFFSAR
jgi:hypothetical protein